jgi:hypothetical protein
LNLKMNTKPPIKGIIQMNNLEHSKWLLHNGQLNKPNTFTLFQQKKAFTL